MADMLPGDLCTALSQLREGDLGTQLTIKNSVSGAVLVLPRRVVKKVFIDKDSASEGGRCCWEADD